MRAVGAAVRRSGGVPTMAARAPILLAVRGFKTRPGTQKRVPALQRKAGDVASSPVASVKATDTPEVALKAMVSGGYGALLVEDGSGSPEGIITERDFLLKTSLDGSPGPASITDMMTPMSKVISAKPEMSLEKCLEQMLAGGFRHMPVGELGSLSAMLSMRDILKQVVKNGVPISNLTVGDVLVESRARDVDEMRVPDPRAQAEGESPWGIVEMPMGETLSIAVGRMRARKVGSVVAPTMGVDMASSLGAFGIFTERDYVKALAAGATAETPAQEFLTDSSKLVWVEPEMSMMHAINVMATKGIRHLPVRKPQTWLYRPGHAVRGPEPPSLLSVLSMRALCAALLL